MLLFYADPLRLCHVVLLFFFVTFLEKYLSSFELDNNQGIMNFNFTSSLAAGLPSILTSSTSILFSIMFRNFIVLATLVSLTLAAPSAQEKRNQFFCDGLGTSCSHVCACSDSTTQQYNPAGTTAACLVDQNKANIETIYHNDGTTQICKTSVPNQFEDHCNSYGEGATCAPIDKQDQYFPNKRALPVEEKREELVKRKSHLDCYCTDGRGGVADGATATLCSLYTSGRSYTNGYGGQSCPDYRYGNINDATNWWLKECGGFSVQNGATCVPEK